MEDIETTCQKLETFFVDINGLKQQLVSLRDEFNVTEAKLKDFDFNKEFIEILLESENEEQLAPFVKVFKKQISNVFERFKLNEQVCERVVSDFNDQIATPLNGIDKYLRETKVNYETQLEKKTTELGQMVEIIGKFRARNKELETENAYVKRLLRKQTEDERKRTERNNQTQEKLLKEIKYYESTARPTSTGVNAQSFTNTDALKTLNKDLANLNARIEELDAELKLAKSERDQAKEMLRSRSKENEHETNETSPDNNELYERLDAWNKELSGFIQQQKRQSSAFVPTIQVAEQINTQPKFAQVVCQQKENNPFLLVRIMPSINNQVLCNGNQVLCNGSYQQMPIERAPLMNQFNSFNMQPLAPAIPSRQPFVNIIAKPDLTKQDFTERMQEDNDDDVSIIKVCNATNRTLKQSNQY